MFHDSVLEHAGNWDVLQVLGRHVTGLKHTWILPRSPCIIPCVIQVFPCIALPYSMHVPCTVQVFPCIALAYSMHGIDPLHVQEKSVNCKLAAILEYKGLCKIVLASTKKCFCSIVVPGHQPTKSYSISNHAVSSPTNWNYKKKLMPMFLANEWRSRPLYNFPIENGSSCPPVQPTPRALWRHVQWVYRHTPHII